MTKFLNNKITIFIDESGTLPDPKDKVVIVAAVGTKLPDKLLEIEKKIRKGLRQQKKKDNIAEIKFYHAGDKTKQKFLELLLKCEIDIFVLIIQKDQQRITDSPENFALLSYLLIEQVLFFYPADRIEKIIFDKHFHQTKDLALFSRLLLKFLKRQIKIQHVDSLADSRVNSADMVAGSLLWKYTGKDDKFYKIICDKIISENVLHWKQAKRKLFKFEKTKNH